MGEIVKATAKAAKKGVKTKLKIWFACLLATILVVGSAGGSFLIVSKVFENKLNQMVDNQYKGETGERGPQGPQGVSILSIEKTGTNGNYDIYTISYSNGLSTTFQVKNGDDGEAPVIGENGHWYINGEDTGIVADASLTMPYVGANGNWWLGDTDTNVKAQGQDGQTPYIKNGNWWVGNSDTGVAATTGVTAITPLNKNTTAYDRYITEHELEADLTDVYQIIYSDSTITYFHVINGREGSGTSTGSGINGADAQQWLTGKGEPLATLGKPNDFYFCTGTNEVYQKQAPENISVRYEGKLVETTMTVTEFNALKANADECGLSFTTNAINYKDDDITMTQINALTTATGMENFYNYYWNYLADQKTVHLFGYIGAEGALDITDGTITKIHYTWKVVSTLKGQDGTNGENGASAYEVWCEYNGYDADDEDSYKEFINSLIIGSLDNYVILPSGYWGEATELTDADFASDNEDEEDEEQAGKIPASEKYLYEKIGDIWYKNTMVSARGEQGAKGQKGEQGAQGQPGVSAYELYTQTTKDNPIKSMDDWLASLVGAQGAQGEQGKDGYTPVSNSETGTWWINGKDTGIRSSVTMPYIGENGNWWIDGKDSNKPARGEQGIAGNGIDRIEKTTVDGVLDTYKIYYTNPGLNDDDANYLQPFTFTVKNGIDGTNGKSSYEIWRDYEYKDEDGTKTQPNLLKSEADFFAALMGTDGNGIESIEMVQSNATTGVDTYRITYTNETTFDFTIKNGRDGASVYDIWCKQKDKDDGADHYEEFFNDMSVGTIQGLMILPNGNWGIVSDLTSIPTDQEDQDIEYALGFDNKVYRDTKVPARGDSGANGKSAYEIYCETFRADPRNAGLEPISTEFAWIESLKGATGAAGKDATLSISEDGYWVINGTEFRNMKVQGEKGEKGDTPYIDADGYWCVGDTNLGVLAKGPQGPKGDTGATGISISAVTKDGSDGAVDTYKISFSDGTTTNFTVTNGTDGTDGTNGAGISMDFGIPTATGKDGDIYINLDNGEMYRYGNGSWGTVVGTMRGSQWFTGTKTLSDLNKDSSGLKIDGFKVIKNDLYLNTVNRDVYKYDRDENENLKWVYLGNLGGAGAVKTDPVAWLDTNTLPNLPDGANVKKFGIGGDTSWSSMGKDVKAESFSIKNGILSLSNNPTSLGGGGWRLLFGNSAVGTIVITKWKNVVPSQRMCYFAPSSSYEVISGSDISTGDWQVTVLRFTQAGQPLEFCMVKDFECEYYYAGNLDYSTQLMDLSGNYHNATVNGNYMTDDGLVLNKTVATNATAWNTTNMTYFVDFANVKQNGDGTALFGVGTPGAASQFSVDINTNRDLFINGSMAGRTLANNKPLTMAVRVDGDGKCAYTVDGVVWQNVTTDKAAAVAGAQLYFGGTGSVLRRAMVFDYLLDDAAVYAIFNHQIADLPNPQSPYKKDNPKTWDDGTLIDFGDGTAGVAKKFSYNETAGYVNLCPKNYSDIKMRSIISWGGSLYNNVMYGDLHQISFDVKLFFSPEIITQPSTNQDLVLHRNGSELGDGNGYELWVWAIVEYK